MKNLTDASWSNELATLAAKIRTEISTLTTLSFVRHGSTEWNEHGKFNSRTNLELSQEGAALCRMNAHHYKTILDNQYTIISSPMLRCVQTVELLFPGARFTTDESITEMDFGGFEGFSPSEVRANGRANELDVWRNYGNDDPVLDVETVQDVLVRTLAFFKANSFEKQSIVLVSHGVFSRILLAVSIGLDPLLYRALRLDNCKWAQIENEELLPRLTCLNGFPDAGAGE